MQGGLPLDDNVERIPDLEINIIGEDKVEYKAALLCDPKGLPEYLRVRIPDLSEKEIPENALSTIQLIKEHMLSCLKLIYDINASFAEPTYFYGFFENGVPHSIKLEFTIQGEILFDKDRFKNLFMASFDTRQLLRLYADGINTSIPVQYRFLSFYKILESRFKEGGRWKKELLKSAVEEYTDKFKMAGLDNDPLSIIHDLRDKCAHLKVGKSIKREKLGVTHLNYKEVIQAEQVLPILREICANAINKRSEGKYVLATNISPEKFKKVD